MEEAARANGVVTVFIENYKELFEDEALQPVSIEDEDATVRIFNRRHDIGTLRLASKCVEEEDAVLHIKRRLSGVDESNVPSPSSSDVSDIVLERPRTPNSLRLHEGSVRSSKIKR
jgi:hypothetical protein